MKTTIEDGTIYHLNSEGGLMPVPPAFADALIRANGGDVDDFMEKHEGRTYLLTDELKIMPNFYVIPDGQDGANLPTQPDPVPVTEIGEHVANYLRRFVHQGYFSNCRREHIPLHELRFTLVSELAWEGATAADYDGPFIPIV